jgi:hypothetical protein
MREEIVPRELAVDANRDAIALVGADVAIQRINVAFGKIRFDFFEERIEDRFTDRAIGIAPIDVAFAGGLFDKRLIFGRTAGVGTRIDDELSVATQDTFATSQRMLDELRRRKVLPEVSGFEFLRNSKNGRIPRAFV